MPKRRACPNPQPAPCPAQITQKLSSLRGLASRLQEVDAYLQNVLNGRLPINHQIIYGLQVRVRVRVTRTLTLTLTLTLTS